MKTRSDITLVLLGLVLAAGDTLGVAAQASPDVEAEIATGIVDLMPDGAGSDFPADVGEVFCWTRITGAEGTRIHHVWIHGENEFSVPLAIGGSPWRTWSSKVVPEEWAGEWRVEIRDDGGNLLDALSFTVG